MTEPLIESSIHHAGLKPVFHPRLGVNVNGQTAVRYLRFTRKVCVRRLELAPFVYGRWVPNVPTHPAHLIISVLDQHTLKWNVVREVDLPRDPRIAGQGVSQRMSEGRMNAHFAKVLLKKPHVIDLGGLETDHLRVECDREHPVWPSHGECNGGEYNVPFGILNPLKAYGRVLEKTYVEPPYLPLLKVGPVRPRSPRGMTVRRHPLMLLFESKYLSVGFSLQRPILLHLGWDALGQGRAGNNRLLNTTGGDRCFPLEGGLSGPILRTLSLDCMPLHWTGEVSVEGNKVRYRNLHCGVNDIRVDATFVIEPKRMILDLKQTGQKKVPVIESEAWRLTWDNHHAMTGAMAMPTLQSGRNGEVRLPMLWAGDGVGCLACRTLKGEDKTTRLQVESYKLRRAVTGGFILGRRPEPDACPFVPAGKLEAAFEWTVTNLEPRKKADAVKPSYGIRSSWSSVFACYRPEFGGFSNNAISTNCHVNQGCPTEMIAFTQCPKSGPNPLDLYRFTIERALLDGGGYGYWRNLYLDSDPVLVSAAGRIHQADPKIGWLRRVEPGLLETGQRILGTIGREGLVICEALSGNSGSYRWSSNAMDVVGFGHMDAYVNAWTYRALRNATALLEYLGHKPMAQRCQEAAEALRSAFGKYLLNPETGWVAGWRSRDGYLHDYGFTWVNGPACAFGLLDPKEARTAMLNLERLREKVGAGSAVGGIPFNLLPIAREDHMLPQRRNALTFPTFENYTDGSMSVCSSGYYLRALSICGLKDRAQKMARELDQGYAAGLWFGGSGSGVEFRSWSGIPNGYEGTFVASFGALYGIAIEQGIFQPPDPEWWPKRA